MYVSFMKAGFEQKLVRFLNNQLKQIVEVMRAKFGSVKILKQEVTV